MGLFSRGKDRLKKDQDRAAQRTILDELFNDYYRARHDVYRMNFVRGIFFGLGSALGGTVVLAILVYVLSQVAGAFFGDGWLQGVRDAISRPQQ